MEMDQNSHPLATESFSRSWFIDRDFIFPEHLNDMEQNFDFDVHLETSSSHVSLVPADEIFSDGQIMPVYNDTTRAETLNASASCVPPSPVVSSYALATTPLLVNRNRYWYKWKWRESSKRVFHKCFGFVRPLLRFSRKSIRVDDLERKVCEVQSLRNSVIASPRASSAYPVVEFSDMKKIGEKKSDLYSGLKKVRSWNGATQEQFRLSTSHPTNSCCDVENSIHEAILHCKRSIEK